MIIGLLVLPACGSSEQKSPSERPAVSLAPASSSAVDPSTAAGEAALVAYRAMWKAYIDGGRTTQPRYDEIARYADGDALKALRAGLDTNKRDGLIVKGDVATNPTVTNATPANLPDTVEVLDCLDTSASTRVKATPGATPYTDSPGGRRKVTATVESLAGTWKVTSFIPFAVGSC